MQGLRFGFIDKETDDGIAYPVRFDDRERQVLDMLPVCEREHAHPYAVGDRVACLVTDGGDTGIILGLVPHEGKPLPVKAPTLDRRTYSDGAIVEYDASAHKLRATLPGGGTVEITGNLTVNGTIHATGNIQSDSNVQAGGDVTAGLTSLKTHFHMAPGGFSPAPTGGPLP